MIETAIEFSRYFAAMLFGMVVAVSFVECLLHGKLPGAGVLYRCCIYYSSRMSVSLGHGHDVENVPTTGSFSDSCFYRFIFETFWLIALTSMVTTFLCCHAPLDWQCVRRYFWQCDHEPFGLYFFGNFDVLYSAKICDEVGSAFDGTLG